MGPGAVRIRTPAPVPGALVPVPQFEVAAKRRGPRAVVSASGELDIATAPQLSAVVALAMGSRPDELCIDLTALTFIDSTGLNVLCQANDRYDGRLVIICPPGNVRRVFDIAGLAGLLPLCDGLESTGSRSLEDSQRAV
ncbi:MAG TPA: STAS domain-containing protein [Solirubrobacteraceae bacterium]|nr:STAS domain-containing protein [Solirubrobacteraceae bacterium]